MRYFCLPFRGSPLNILNDFSAFSGRPFDASHVGVSGIGINSINDTTLIVQLIALTNRQFVYFSILQHVKFQKKIRKQSRKYYSIDFVRFR